MNQQNPNIVEPTPEKPNKEIRETQVEENIQPDPEINESGAKVAETVEGLDVMTGAEKVSEVKEKASEQKPVQKTQTGTKQQAKKTTAESEAAIKERLLKKLPAPVIMKHQIKHELNKEVSKLKSQARQANRKGAAYELNKIVARLRELKELISSLAHATYEYIRNLWLKVVHGIA